MLAEGGEVMPQPYSERRSTAPPGPASSPCEGDLIGKTQTELRALHFRRDREWLQS